MFEGTLTVDYGGVLSPLLLEDLTEANGALKVTGRKPLTIRAADLDRTLYRILPFLGDPAMRVNGVRVRRGA
ncbi:MAG: hypothetical protein RDU89_07455 [bacterium]|nr:hypothetical protein [bacterium]